VPDSGTGILAGAARLVSRNLQLPAVPELRLCTAIINDPTGDLFAHDKPPSWWRRSLYRFYEKLQGIQAAKGMVVVVHLSESGAAWLLRTLSKPVNFIDNFINMLKSRSFPYSIDSFVPRTSGSRGMLMVGSAAVDAANQFRAAALPLASRLLDLPVGELECSGDGVRESKMPGKSVPWRSWPKPQAARSPRLAARLFRRAACSSRAAAIRWERSITCLPATVSILQSIRKLAR